MKRKKLQLKKTDLENLSREMLIKIHGGAQNGNDITYYCTDISCADGHTCQSLTYEGCPPPTNMSYFNCDEYSR